MCRPGDRVSRVTGPRAVRGRWARYAPAALVAVLLVATGAAFLRTESLKLETSPIRQTKVTKLFSPVCRCATSKARIAIRVAKPDVVSVSIEDDAGQDVRQLVAERPATGRIAFLWNGRGDDGQVVRDGTYRARVRLDLIEKTFLLPNLIRVDTKRPTLKVVSVPPRVLARRRPQVGQDRRALHGRRESERDALRRRRQARRRCEPQATGTLRWYGMVGGQALPAGGYRLAVQAVDRAGNASPLVDAGAVRIRYIVLVPTRLRATAGGFVRVRVSTDARRVSWKLGSRSGTATRSGVPDQGAEDAAALPPRRLGQWPQRGRHRRRRGAAVTRRRWIVVALVIASLLAGAAIVGGWWYHSQTAEKEVRRLLHRRVRADRASRRRNRARPRSSTRCRGRRSATTTSGRTCRRSSTGPRTSSSGTCARAGSWSSRPRWATGKCS